MAARYGAEIGEVYKSRKCVSRWPQNSLHLASTRSTAVSSLTMTMLPSKLISVAAVAEYAAMGYRTPGSGRAA